jgi:hypothetical protein
MLAAACIPSRFFSRRWRMRDGPVDRQVDAGSSMRAQSAATKGAIARELRDICWPLLEAGELAVGLDGRRFTLGQAADAHRLVESGGQCGAVALLVDHGEG